MEARIEVLLSGKLARLLAEHRVFVFGFVVVCAFVSVFLARRLTIEISWVNLFPDDTPEVISFRAVSNDIESTENLIVAISGPEKARDAFAYKVAEALKQNKHVASADAEVPADYLGRHWLYYIELDDLRKLSAALQESVEGTRQRAHPFYVALDDDDPWEPTNEIARKIFDKQRSKWEFLHHRTKDASSQAPGSNDKPTDLGVELDKILEPHKPATDDGKYRLVEVRPRATVFTQTEEYETILTSMKASLSALEKPPGVDWRISGFMVISLSEFYIANSDLTHSTLLSFGLVLLILLVATRRLSILPIVGFTLICGLLISLGLSQLIFGRLTLISGFSLPVLLGLGVDFCIHIHIAYRAAMTGIAPDDHRARSHAIAAVMEQMLVPCAAAAFTTSLGFSALMVNDFKGVSEYGALAGLGLLTMFGVAFLVFPALLYWFDKNPRPVRSAADSPMPDGRTIGKALPLGLLAAVGIVAVVFISGVNKVPFYDNYREMRGSYDDDLFHQYIMDQTGGALNGALVMANDEAHARLVVDAATQVKDAQKTEAITNLTRIYSMTQLLPTDIEARVAEIAKMDQALDDLPFKHMKEDDKKSVESFRRFTRAPPPKADEMPQYFKDRLRSPAGKWVVSLFAGYELATDDEFLAWTEHIDAVRQIVAKQGPVPPIIDQGSVAARLRLVLQRTLWPMTLLAAGLVVLVTILAFRRPLPTIGVLVALAVGVFATFGAIPFVGMHLNLHNVVILPSIIGIGIDNAVHIMHGFLETRDIRKTLATRGLACFLSSATTAVGFGALLIANHGGIRSLGHLAILGMSCVFATTTIALPAALALIQIRRQRAEQGATSNT